MALIIYEVVRLPEPQPCRYCGERPARFGAAWPDRDSVTPMCRACAQQGATTWLSVDHWRHFCQHLVVAEKGLSDA